MQEPADHTPPTPKLDSLTNAAGFHRTDPRTREAGFYPGALSGRGIAPLEKIAITTSSVAVSNGDVASLQLLTRAVSEELLLVSNEVAIYVNGLAVENLLPPIINGSTTNPTDWNFFGGVNALVAKDPDSGLTFTPTDSQNAYTIIVTNISAGNVTLIFQARSKYILNRGGASS